MTLQLKKAEAPYKQSEKNRWDYYTDADGKGYRVAPITCNVPGAPQYRISPDYAGSAGGNSYGLYKQENGSYRADTDQGELYFTFAK